MSNYSEKYEDLQKLHDYKVITTFQMLLINELRRINDSMDKDVEDSLINMLVRIYGSIDDLSSDLTENFTELQDTIKNKS
jgi:hypothetical protein